MATIKLLIFSNYEIQLDQLTVNPDIRPAPHSWHSQPGIVAVEKPTSGQGVSNKRKYNLLNDLQ